MLARKKLAASAALLAPLLMGPAVAGNGGGSDAAGAQAVVDASAAVIHSLSSNRDFMNLLKRAKGVFIVPSLVKGALVIGASGGTGVLVAHDDGNWSNPAFLTIGSISVGAQAGGEAGPVVMFLMTHTAVGKFTQKNNLSLDADADVTFVTWSPNAQASIGKGDVIVWSGENGAFAGLVVKGADVHDDVSYDEAYYDGKYSRTKQIVENPFRAAKANKLLGELPG